MTLQNHTITEVTVTTNTTPALWDELTRQLEKLFDLSISKAVRHPQALIEQIYKVDAAIASLRAAFSGLNRRDHVAASLYDQVDLMITSSLWMSIQPHATPDMSALVKDLADKSKSVYRYRGLRMQDFDSSKSAGPSRP